MSVSVSGWGGVWDQVKKGVSEKSSGTESEEHLEKWSRLRGVRLDWDEHQDKAWSSRDQKGGGDSIHPETGLGVIEERQESGVLIL